MIYESYKELSGNMLDPDDEVIFKVNGKEYRGIVRYSYLFFGGVRNFHVFEELGLDKVDFCSKHYGYHPSGGSWPNSKNQDFEALTRVVLALFKLCDNNEIEIKKGWVI